MDNTGGLNIETNQDNSSQGILMCISFTFWNCNLTWFKFDKLTVRIFCEQTWTVVIQIAAWKFTLYTRIHIQMATAIHSNFLQSVYFALYMYKNGWRHRTVVRMRSAIPPLPTPGET